MALDVYVGSLTRYYAGAWENISDRTARERGIPRRGERPGAPADRGSPDILAWRSTLGRALGGRIAVSLDWGETPETPYFTGRPGWDGFGSLVMWAAYADLPALRRPASLPEEWESDPVLMRNNEVGGRARYGHLVRHVELWLPGSFEVAFEGADVDGRRLVMGSTTVLRRQLEELNATTWKADQEVVAGWRRKPPVGEGPLELKARHGFAVLLGLVERAVEHGLPMKLDY